MTGKHRRASGWKRLIGRSRVRYAIADWRSDRAIHAPSGSHRGGRGNRAAARSSDGRTDATAFHFPLFAATRLIARARVRVEVAGKGQEARIEANQSSIVFGECGGKIVNQISRAMPSASEMRERDNGQGLEALAVLELQILYPAVPVNQSERVEFPLIALVVERIEVTAVGLEAFARLSSIRTKARYGFNCGLTSCTCRRRILPRPVLPSGRSHCSVTAALGSASHARPGESPE
jgi:hypothetical protein